MQPARTLVTILGLAALLAAPALAEIGYVGLSTPDEAYSFDLDSYLVGPPIDLLPEGDYPYDATILPSGWEVWIPGAAGDGVVVIFRDTGAVIQRIATGEYPVSVAFNGDGTMALVSCRDSDRLDRISTNTYQVFGSLPIPPAYLGPGNIALDPTSGNFYLVNWYGDILYEIAEGGDAILRQVPLGDSLWQLVADPDGELLYITDRGTDQLRVVDRATLAEVTALPVGDDPWGVDVTLDGDRVVVCCEDSGSVHIFDTSDWSSETIFLPPEADPRDLDILDEDGLAFVAGGTVTGDDPVYRIDIMSATNLGPILIPQANPNVVAVQVQANSSGTGVPVVPAAKLELEIHPNPFNPATRIRYTLASAATVQLTIHDISGRLLRVLESNWREPGSHESIWDGRGNGEDPVTSGLYLVRLSTPTEMIVRKAVLLK